MQNSGFLWLISWHFWIVVLVWSHLSLRLSILLIQTASCPSAVGRDLWFSARKCSGQSPELFHKNVCPGLFLLVGGWEPSLEDSGCWLSLAICAWMLVCTKWPSTLLSKVSVTWNTLNTPKPPQYHQMCKTSPSGPKQSQSLKVAPGWSFSIKTNPPIEWNQWIGLACTGTEHFSYQDVLIRRPLLRCAPSPPANLRVHHTARRI